MKKAEIIAEKKDKQEVQAVIFADSFESKFEPISYETPKALMNMANIPLIEYAIQFLNLNRIKKVIIFASTQKSKLIEYFRGYKISDMKIKVVSSENCKSVGDALRAIHSMQIIQGDFIIMRCDVIANFDLSQALDFHFKKKEEDKYNILTKIFKRLNLKNQLRQLQMKHQQQYIFCQIIFQDQLNGIYDNKQ